jgi:hypothetical protein
MGLLDSVKGLVGGNKKTIDTAVDKGADFVEEKTPDSVDAQVQKGAEMVKDAIDKIDDK